ncbi:putative integral membrane protein [Theileria parva strain Muguga]|uniref:Uncharacterized protein n=1 Tax=Theileria parva TaxID=5875 RepID=Q4N0G9_THEPA|nr:putative integral membrane protein [Theileria parva strain Muguga]EAN30910.1 putative integral membrane protein [Theileria parva strain Muguga]|eukprot:XP_763193.1 hypothetical protein [Theileria parva strain Muguga]
MRVGIINLLALLGFLLNSTKFAGALYGRLNDGMNSLNYDPNLLSLLQMEQSMDLDDDDDLDYFKSSFLEHSSDKSSVLQSDWDEGSFLEEDDLDSDAWGNDQDESFLQDDDSDDSENFDDSFLEDESTEQSADEFVNEMDLDDAWQEQGESLLQTGAYYGKSIASPTTFGSLIQLHNYEPDPMNFLQDETLLVMNDDDQTDLDLVDEGKKPSVKAFVLKSDNDEGDTEVTELLEESRFEKLMSTLWAYKVWLVVVVVLLVIALVVKFFFYDRFLKFKTEVSNKFDNMNKVFVDKFNGVFRKSQNQTQNEETPLLSA